MAHGHHGVCQHSSITIIIARLSNLDSVSLSIDKYLPNLIQGLPHVHAHALVFRGLPASHVGGSGVVVLLLDYCELLLPERCPVVRAFLCGWLLLL